MNDRMNMTKEEADALGLGQYPTTQDDNEDFGAAATGNQMLPGLGNVKS
jgi:hypothetical protein